MTERVLPYLITILALALPSPSFPLFLLILSLTTYILTSTALPLASLNFSQGAALAAHLFAANDYLLLSDVHNDLKRLGQTGAWETMGQWERVRWAASLVTSPRLIGWSSSLPSRSPTPPSPSTSTTTFILRQSLHLLLELLALLLLLTFSSSLPHLSATGPTLAAASYPLRLLYAPLLALAMYASIDAPHRIWVLLLLCVGNTVIRVYNRFNRRERRERAGGREKVMELDVWKPADFPPLFGYWPDAYTLRRFWGRTWQQTHRRVRSLPSSPLSFPFLFVCPPSASIDTFPFVSSPSLTLSRPHSA
ncbi:hypothetical protein CCMSSC00406_0007337 [Pleurotus cornucopiae]|uniref:Uncharacterized protein n=1 Tax=Pleurotus cornucopiae TaxID=5321 RepID=A0ACB7IU47_PLECO|nr:hypothetical protein CCMSSC00406_0007337 [Pleurotus cornucopiae]